MNKVTIKDVAKLAGVSDTTVSLAFKDGSRISKDTRDRVMAAAAELSYAPNLAAKNLRNGKSRTIGFVVNDITNPFYSQMLRVAEDIAQQNGYSVIFAGSNWSGEKEKYLFEQMVQMRVCGVIMCLCEKSEEGVGVLDKFNVPYITVDSYPEWYKGSYVANDFSVASEMAAKHLYEQGCRKPAYFTAGSEMKDLSSFVKMQKYFNEYFINKGIPQQGCGVVEAGLSIKEGHAAFERVLKSGKKYDGIFCANDLCAMGVMQAAEKYNIIAGRDIAVVGIDDIEVSAFSRVSLTTIKQPYWTIAKIAMEKLVEGVESNLEIDVKIEFPAELIVRNSSKLLIK